MDWKIVDTGLASAEVIMQKDREFLEKMASETKPILHFYHFEKNSATYGHFLKTENFFNSVGVEKEGLRLAKRPTGGGIIFHLWDFAFSVLIPATHALFSQNTLENYATINQAVLLAVEEFLEKKGCELTAHDGAILGVGCEHFCMAKPTKYDVMLNGKKVAGAAQRKTRDGLLHQGSISLVMPSKEFLESVLLPELSVLEGMFSFTFPILGKEASEEDLAMGRVQIKELLKKYLTKE